MKTLKSKVLMLLVVSVLTLYACASTTPYKILFTSGVTYDALMKSVADLKERKLITDEQWQEIRRLAIAYYVAYQAAIDAYVLHEKINSAYTKDKFEEAVKEVTRTLKNLEEYINLIREALKK